MPKHGEEDEESQYSEQSSKKQKAQIRKPKIDRIDKFKNLKKIVINLSMTQYPVVSEVAEDLGWKLQYNNEAGDWDIYWTDFAVDPDVLIKMHIFQKINHYSGIHVIARKNLLGLGLMALRNKFPDEYNFFPLTWMLPQQYAEFRSYFENKQKGKARTYIAKPEAQCQGRGIFLTRKIEDLQNGKHYVVQRYLARPFLIDGLKFDLRIYVLLCGTNPLRLYIYNQGLGRLATERYTQPSSSNLDKQYVHLTNYAINKNNTKFVFNNSSNNMGIGHKRSLQAIYKQLAARGVDIVTLKKKINDVAIKTIICGLPLMSHQYKCSQPQDYAGNMCFHLLGLDIMMNSKGEPVLLEVNHTPSFTTDTPLDHKIKFNLIKDTLNLMNVNVKQKNDLLNRAKDLNRQRLITGKRQIFQGKQRQAAIEQAQRQREEYESKNLGGFQKIFPINDQQKMSKYNEIIDNAMKTYAQQNGSIRMRMQQRQAKRLIRNDYKQMKRSKLQKQRRQSQPRHGNTTSTNLMRSTSKMMANQLNSHHRQNDLMGDEDQSMDQIENFTKSETNIDTNKQYAVEPNLIKKYSEINEKQRGRKTQKEETIPSRSIIYQPRRGSIQKNKKSRKKQKVEPNPTTPHSVHVNSSESKNERAKSYTISKTPIRSRKNHRIIKNPQLPNILENLVAHSDIHSTRKQQKSSNLQRNLRSQTMTEKLNDHLATDLREMVDRKVQPADSQSKGGYVMPKLISLDLSAERRCMDNKIYMIIPGRKRNPNNFFNQRDDG